MAELCTDNRFELIEKYKQKLIEATNITDALDEMTVIDNILFRFWQMGWLDRLEQSESCWIPVSEQLPHDEDNVLVTRYFTLPYLGESKVYWYVEQAEYCDGRWYPAVDDEDKVGIHSGPIAWMPLPQPYKGDKT